MNTALAKQGKETLPGSLPTVDVYIGYLARGKQYATEVLAPGGLSASKGTTITAKLKKFFLMTTGKAELLEITVDEWEALWATLDALAQDGNDKAVAAIETTLAYETKAPAHKEKETLGAPRWELDTNKALNDLASINPETMTDDDLGAVLERALGFTFCTLRMCKPLIQEMRERFKARKKTDKPIRGCKSFQEWCRKVLHRSEQAVYLLLRENKPEPLVPEPFEPLPVLPEQKVEELLNIFGEKLPVIAVHTDKQGDEHITWTADSVDATVVGVDRVVSPGKIIPPEDYSHIAVVGVVNTFIMSLIKHLTRDQKRSVMKELVALWKRRL